MNIGLIPLESKPAKYFPKFFKSKFFKIVGDLFLEISGLFKSNFMKMFSTVTVEHLKN